MTQNQRGFAAMEPDQQKRIASKGGKAAHQSGHAHEWTSAEAAEAGRKGGLASHQDRASFHQDTAAHHQAQASKHRSEGSEDTARLHEGTAATHAEKAKEYDELSASAGQDPSSSQQYREPGRRGADARWGRSEEEPGAGESEDQSPQEEESDNDNRRRRSGGSTDNQASQDNRS